MSMAQEQTPSTPKDPFSYNTATPLQRDIIIELAQHYPDGVAGVDVRNSLKDHYGEKVKKATFYTSVDRLVDQDLVKKNKDEISGRSHKLRLTDECANYLEEYIQWCRGRGLFNFDEVDQ